MSIKRPVELNLMNNGVASEAVDPISNANYIFFDNGRTLPEELDMMFRYTNPNIVPKNIGGIHRGDTFMQVKYSDIITRLLYSSESNEAIITTMAPKYSEVPLENVLLNISISRMSSDITSAELYESYCDEYGSYDQSNATKVSDLSVSTSGGNVSYTLPTINHSTALFVKVTGSDGNISISEPIEIYIRMPIFIGLSSLNNVTLSTPQSDIVDNTYSVVDFKGSGNGTNVKYKFDQFDNKRMMIVANDQLGDLQIRDTNGLDITRSFDKYTYTYTKSTTTTQCTVYMSNFTSQLSGFEITAIFSKNN